MGIWGNTDIVLVLGVNGFLPCIGLRDNKTKMSTEVLHSLGYALSITLHATKLCYKYYSETKLESIVVLVLLILSYACSAKQFQHLSLPLIC